MDTLFPFEDELSQRLGLPVESPTYTTDSNNNSDTDKISDDKYSLRPRSLRRRNLEQVIEKTKSRTPKPKQKPAPLSKYRRKTANARERTRMREINQAFETLRQAVPAVPETNVTTNEKLTKITTLKLAMKYISTLSAALNGPDFNFSSDFLSDCSDLDLYLESDGESLGLTSDHSLTPPDFSMDFPDDSITSMDFSPISEFSEHLSGFDTFLSNIS